MGESRMFPEQNPSYANGRRFAATVLACISLILLGSTGCSIRKMAAGGVANTLAESSSVFSSDDDPELIRDAVPFGLKTMEALLEILPKHRGLLLSTCQGFTQYAYAFVQLDADALAVRDRRQAERLQTRALKLFQRARGYGLRGLELRYRGIGGQLQRDPERAAARVKKSDLDLLYWTAAAWGSAINAGRDQPELIADIAAVRVMMERTLELDETYGRGAAHEVMIAIEAGAGNLGGSFEQARRHFERSIELSAGLRAGPFVTLAEMVSVPTQNRKEFVELLEAALAIDPDRELESRLPNIMLQRKARSLLERADDLFLNLDQPAEGDF